MCFHANSKSPHADQCVKSRILNKAVDSILSIDIFEQQCVVIKGVLQSSRLEDHMKTIGIDQSSFTRSSLTRTIISSHLENEDNNTIQNTTDTSNTDDIHSCVTPQKQNYCV